MPKEKEIIIPNPVNVRCPECGVFCLMKNDETGEMLFRQISIVYINKVSGMIKVKCRQCHGVVEINA